MKNFIQDGATLPLTAPAGGVASGNGYLIGTLFVVAAHSAAAGEKFSGARLGVYELPKAAGQAWSEGAVIYWDNTAKNCTTVSTSNTRIAFATAATDTAVTTGRVVLFGAP